MEHYFSKLQNTIKSCWDKAALCNYNGESFTFGDLALNIAKFHIFFQQVGVSKGDKIALCAKNSARWAISFLSINTYETVVVPILADFHPTNVGNLVAHSGSVALFTDPEIWEQMDRTAFPDIMFAISTKDFTLLYYKNEEIRKAFESIPEAMASRYPMGFNGENVSFPTDNDRDLAVINYTSGTTSAPKGVMLRYECFSTSVDFGYRYFKVYHDDSVVSMLPMGHIYGLVFEFLFPLCHGATIHYLGKTPSPTLLLKAMKDVRPFMVVSVPLVMEKIYKSSIKPVLSKWYMTILTHTPFIRKSIYRKIGEKVMDAFGGKVRMFIMGGAALNQDVDKCLKRIGLPYTVGYGMTEASPLLTYAPPKDFVPGSCGRAIDCTEVRIDSEDPAHIAGEIQARGRNICSGYYNNAQATANAFTEDGFLHTGDLGIMDAQGNIFIKGRSKNMILSANGQNIYPEEIEAIVNGQKFIAESVVVDRSNKLVALVYLDQEAIKKAKLDEEAIADIPEQARINANRQLPGYSKIAKVEVVLTPFEKTPKMSIKRFLYS